VAAFDSSIMAPLLAILGVHSVVTPLRAVPKMLEPLASSGAGLLSSYRQLATTHYVPVAACQSAVMRGGSDLARQMMSSPAPVIDAAHVAAIAAIALFVSGFGGSIWLRHLESQLGCSNDGGFKNVLAKTAADFTCWAPVANSAYLLGVPALTTGDVGTALAGAHASLPSAMALEALIFVPYNLIAFSLVPPALRPSIQAVLACLFTIGLSSLC